MNTGQCILLVKCYFKQSKQVFLDSDAQSDLYLPLMSDKGEKAVQTHIFIFTIDYENL